VDTQPDPSADAETIAIQFSPPDATPTPSSTRASNKLPGGPNRRRILLLSGAAVLAIASIAGVLALSGGDSHSTSASRTDTQIGDGNGPTNGDQPGGAGSQKTSEQGGGGSGSGTSGTPSSLGAAGGQSSHPGTDNGSSNPTKPGHPSAPIAPTGNGNQPTTPPQGAKPPGYAGRLVSSAAQTSSAATTATVQTSAASSPGDALLLSVMLTNTHAGAVSASDSAGNTYSVIADQSDGSGDRTLILAATAAKALSPGTSVTLTFPATQERHITLDAFTGVTAIGTHSSATAASGPFSSGSTSASATGIVFAAAGIQGGENASWSAGFSALPTLLVAPADQLATAYETVTPGSYQAAGSCNHQWMAAAVTLAG
jgi:hypothetical protein